MSDRDLGVRPIAKGSKRGAALPTFSSQLKHGSAVKSVPKRTSLDKALKGEHASSSGFERTYSKREALLSSTVRERRGWIQNAAQAQHAVRMLDLRMKREMQQSMHSVPIDMDNDAQADRNTVGDEGMETSSNPEGAHRHLTASQRSGASINSADRTALSEQQKTPIYTSNFAGIRGEVETAVGHLAGHHLSLDMRGVPPALENSGASQGREIVSTGRESNHTPVRTWEDFQKAEAAASEAKSMTAATRKQRSASPETNRTNENREVPHRRAHAGEDKSFQALDCEAHMLAGQIRSLESQLEVQRQTSAKLASMCKANQKEHEQALQRALEQHKEESEKLQESETHLIRRVKQLEQAEAKAQKLKNEPWRHESLENEYFRLKEKLAEMQAKISKETVRATKAEMQLEKHAVDHRAAMQKMKEAQSTLRHSLEDKEALLYAMQQDSGTCSNALENVREYCRKLEAEKLRHSAELHEKEEANEQLRRQAAERQAELERLRQHVVRLQEAGKELEEKSQQRQERGDQLAADNARLQRLAEELEGAKREAKAQLAEQHKTAQLLQAQHDSVLSQYTELEAALRAVHQRQADELQGTMQRVQADHNAKLREQQKELLQRLADKEAAAVELEGERDRLQHAHALLKQMHDKAAHDHLESTSALSNKLSQEKEAAEALRTTASTLEREKALLEQELERKEQKAREAEAQLVQEHTSERLKLRRALEEEKEELRRALRGEKEEARRSASQEGEEAVQRARAEAEEERRRLEERVGELRGELSGAAEKVKGLEEAQAREAERARAQGAESEELRGLAEGLAREVQALRGQLAGRDAELAAARLELQALQARLEASEGRAEGAERRAREAEGGKAGLEVSVLTLGEELSAAAAEAREAESRRREAQAQLAALQRRVEEESEARAQAEAAALDAAMRAPAPAPPAHAPAAPAPAAGEEAEQEAQIRSLRRYVNFLESRLHHPPPPTSAPQAAAAAAAAAAPPPSTSQVAALEQRIAQYEEEARQWEEMRAELCCKVAALEGKATRLTASEDAEALEARKLEILATQRAHECGALRQRLLALEQEAARCQQEAERLRGEVEKLRQRNMQLEDEVVRRQLELERAVRERAADKTLLRRSSAQAEAAARRAEELAQQAEAERKRAAALAAQLDAARLKHWLALPNPNASPLPRPLLAGSGGGREEEGGGGEAEAVAGMVERLVAEGGGAQGMDPAAQQLLAHLSAAIRVP